MKKLPIAHDKDGKPIFANPDWLANLHAAMADLAAPRPNLASDELLLQISLNQRALVVLEERVRLLEKK